MAGSFSEAVEMIEMAQWVDFGVAGLMASALILSNWRLLAHFDKAAAQMRRDHQSDMERLVGMVSMCLTDRSKAVEQVVYELVEMRRELRQNRMDGSPSRGYDP